MSHSRKLDSRFFRKWLIPATWMRTSCGNKPFLQAELRALQKSAVTENSRQESILWYVRQRKTNNRTLTAKET